VRIVKYSQQTQHLLNRLFVCYTWCIFSSPKRPSFAYGRSVDIPLREKNPNVGDRNLSPNNPPTMISAGNANERVLRYFSPQTSNVATILYRPSRSVTPTHINSMKCDHISFLCLDAGYGWSYCTVVAWAYMGALDSL